MGWFGWSKEPMAQTYQQYIASIRISDHSYRISLFSIRRQLFENSSGLYSGIYLEWPEYKI
jgi:hypothetical protein